MTFAGINYLAVIIAAVIGWLAGAIYYGVLANPWVAAHGKTMEAFKADTQLLYASDWPHWDFDAPSSITTLPFLNEQAKRNILGLNAARVFNLEVKRKRPKAADVLAARPGVS